MPSTQLTPVEPEVVKAEEPIKKVAESQEAAADVAVVPEAPVEPVPVALKDAEEVGDEEEEEDDEVGDEDDEANDDEEVGEEDVAEVAAVVTENGKRKSVGDGENEIEAATEVTPKKLKTNEEAVVDAPVVEEEAASAEDVTTTA